MQPRMQGRMLQTQLTSVLVQARLLWHEARGGSRAGPANQCNALLPPCCCSLPCSGWAAWGRRPSSPVYPVPAYITVKLVVHALSLFTALQWVGGMKLAAKRAVELGKPWVLDPVGCGATPYRTQVC